MRNQFFTIVLFFIIVTIAHGYSQNKEVDVVQHEKNEVKKYVGRYSLNYFIYNIIDSLVDYFQGDINSMDHVAVGKKYQFDDKKKYWKEEAKNNVELGASMFSGDNINVAIMNIKIDPRFDSDVKEYLYNEVMSRNYKTKKDQSLNFIDTFSLNAEEVEYKSKDDIKSLSKVIDEKEVDRLRKILYFDYYAEIILIRTGINVKMQIVMYDSATKGIILVLDYNEIVVNIKKFPIDLGLRFSMLFGSVESVYIPMFYSVNIGKRLFGIGSFGFDLTMQTYLYNRNILGDVLIKDLFDKVNDPDISRSEKSREINKYAFSSILVGPYFLLNINELARKRTSIFEFYFGTNFRVGYYVTKTDIYKPLFFDFSFFQRTNIGNWFYISLGINTIVMYPTSGFKDVTKMPFGNVNFILALGVDIF